MADQAIFHLINERWTSPALDLFMAVLSDFAIWRPALILLALYLLIFRGFRGRAFVCCLALGLVLSEALAVETLKEAIGRKRPKQMETVRMVKLQKANPRFMTMFKRPQILRSDLRDRNKPGKSFPSGHVINNTIVAVFCVMFFGRWGALCFILTAAVAWSRVYLGAHWPSDVAASFFLGLGLSLLVLALLEVLWTRAVARWAPEFVAQHPSLIHPKTT